MSTPDIPLDPYLQSIKKQLGNDINLDHQVQINDHRPRGNGSYGTVFKGSYREVHEGVEREVCLALGFACCTCRPTQYSSYSHNQSDVCIKVLRWDPNPKSDFIPVRGLVNYRPYGTDSLQYQRLLREIKIWRQLVHQHVVRFRGWVLYPRDKTAEPSLVSNWCEHGHVNHYLGLRTDANRINLVSSIPRTPRRLFTRSR